MPHEIRFVIVEDEPILLAHTQYIIKQMSPHFQICGTASNGADGLREIAQHQPDIIVSDICMPTMSGLEMIRQARAAGSTAQFIILTGYSEFEYAHSAITLGVSSYVLKPIDPDAFYDVLCPLVEKIEAKTDSMRHETIQHFLQHPEDPKQSYPFLNTPVYLAAIQAGVLSRHFSAENSRSAYFWKSPPDLTPVLRTFSIQPFWAEGRYPNERLLILCSEQPLHSIQLHTLASSLSHTLNQTEIPVRLAISGIIEGHDAFLTQMIQAKAALLCAMPFTGRQILFLEEHTLPTDSLTVSPDFQHLAEQLSAQIGLPSFSDSLAELQIYWENNMPSTVLLYQQLQYILFSLRSHIQTPLPAPEELLLDVLSVPEIINALRTFLCSAKIGMEIDSTSHVLRKIKTYLDQHYIEPINGKTLYALSGYNEKYITGLFKRTYGISPSKYIINLRIHHAKQLMASHPHLMMKDIARQVGFHDPLYFSRVFRETVQLSPSEYLKQIQQNPENHP